MTKITREEVRKIAQMSDIAIKEAEIEAIQEQLDGVITYAQRVTKVAGDGARPSAKNTDVWREDLVVYCNPEPILAQAPERAGNFFVVPKIIEHS